MKAAMEGYQLCCCCMELVSLKGLWRQYAWMGTTEVYGDMLEKCFNLSWDQKDDTKDLICEVCITRLRNAVQFKQKVIQCQTTLRLQLLDGVQMMKQEILDIEIPKREEFETDIAMKSECDDYGNQIDDGFHDNNYELNDTTLMKEEKSNLKNGAIKDNFKRPTRKKCQAEENLKIIIKESRKCINPRQNVALILEHSTIVPFKSRSGYFNCFYCSKQFAGFDQLKTHVSELHENISYKQISKSIYRPHDRIRADVSDINCRICKMNIDNLDLLVQHLTDHHNVKFNFDSDIKKPADCILGYDLGEGKYRCCQCKKEFIFFKTLSNHMNEHSTDHVCDVCGRCFLLADRLRAHYQSHKKTIVKCDLCGKICGSTSLLKSHIRYKHTKLPFKCSICDKSFDSSRKRVKHLEEVHNRAPLDLTCKICCKKFDYHINFHRHMRTDHLNKKRERKYSCNVCGMKFATNSGLANHIVVHSGERNYECEVCHKKYGRKKTLTEHLRIHKNDRRFACGVCSQAFVQKCSLKNHIRVHHCDTDYDKLIVDKRLDAK